LDNEVASTIFDGFFALSSSLLALFFGAALGNVIRGVPLGPDFYFFEPLWTSFRPWGETGILDWYTVFTGVFAVVALFVHGALWVTLKTNGEIRARARTLAGRVMPLSALLTILGVPLTILVRPATMHNYSQHPVLYLLPAVVAVAFIMMWKWSRKGEELRAFLASSTYIVALMSGAAAALYPALLPSSNNPERDITIYNAAAGHYALSVGFIWWGVGIALAIGYFVFMYRMFRGKLEDETLSAAQG
jgi:cytochrome d ubiquinol oxidase subunit II